MTTNLTIAKFVISVNKMGEIEIQDINRETYDHVTPTEYSVKVEPGLNEEVVRLISQEKNEPEWMLQKRLECLRLFNKMPMPDWGPGLGGLDINKITFFATADAKKNARSWDDVPQEIKKTFEKLGIPEAERRALAGAGAQFDSQTIYHNLKKEWEEKGVIFDDFDEAVHKYPELVKKHFMTRCVPPSLHKFSALHGAVFSGGTFIYIPKGVKVELPLQAYFRMNSEKMGQFEHTLIIVDEGAEVHYIEGCFRKGSKVSTNPDYKNIEEVEKGDKVLTHDGTYKKVSETHITPYTGTIKKITIFGDSVNKIEVTNDHPFLYVDKKHNRERNKTWKLRWNIPKYFKKGDYLAVPINKTIFSQKFFEVKIKHYLGKKKGWTQISKKIPSTKEFFKLAGYYLAEGSISSGHYLNFSFNKSERKYIEEVKYLLKRVFNIQKTLEATHKTNNGTSVVVCSTELCRIFEQFGTKANRKVIPQWMMLETPEKQKELIKSYFLGDGNYYNQKVKSGLKEVFRVNSVSKKLVFQCRDILLRSGIVSFINGRNRSKENRQTMYTLGITGEYMINFGKLFDMKIIEKLHNKRRGGVFGINKDYAFFPIRKIETEEVENELVFNFSVENNETYCVAGVAAHNCSAPVYDNKSLHAGCVEIFVYKNAKARYSSIENWSKNTYNLNTKRAVVEEDGVIEWVNGNMGCLTGDSKVFTNPKGPIDIKLIDAGDKIYVFDEKTKSIKKSVVKAKIYSGEKKVYRLEAGGREIEASANHPFLTLVRRKNKPFHKKGFFHYEWKPLEELKVDDLVCISKKLPTEGLPHKLPKININEIVKSKNQYVKLKINISYLYGDIRIPEETNEDFMWLMGLLLGDGHVDVKNNKINIATHVTEDYRDQLCSTLCKLFNYKVTEKKERYIIINSKVLCQLFTEIGFGGNADTKTIPNWVFTLPETQCLAFLAGYFDSDGHSHKDVLAFTSISKNILESVRNLAITLGFGTSRIFVHRKAGKSLVVGKMCNTKDSWRILLTGKKIKELPVRCLRKKIKIEKSSPRRNYLSSKGLNIRSKVNDNIGFAKIDKIIYTGVKPTYDIEVENYHNFIANGLVVHNSHVTMLYPCSILIGERSRSDFLGIAFANTGQNQDTGTKVYHLAKNTTSTIQSKSISKGGGITTYRGLIKVAKGCTGVKCNVECDALMADNKSQSNTIPVMEINENDVDIAHEATVGRIGDEQIFYLMSRGLTEEQAVNMIVSGFIEPIVRELPMEYAVELNRLIELEMEGSLG